MVGCVKSGDVPASNSTSGSTGGSVDPTNPTNPTNPTSPAYDDLLARLSITRCDTAEAGLGGELGRRRSHSEYIGILRSVFGEELLSETNIIPILDLIPLEADKDPALHFDPNNFSIEGLINTAEQIVDFGLAEPHRLRFALGFNCDPTESIVMTDPNDACRKGVVERVVPRIFGRTLSSTEVDNYVLPDVGRYSGSEALRYTLIRLLISPYATQHLLPPFDPMSSCYVQDQIFDESSAFSFFASNAGSRISPLARAGSVSQPGWLVYELPSSKVHTDIGQLVLEFSTSGVVDVDVNINDVNYLSHHTLPKGVSQVALDVELKAESALKAGVYTPSSTVSLRLKQLSLVGIQNNTCEEEVSEKPSGRERLGAGAIASRLAFAFTDEPPDAQLLAAAEQGQLNFVAELKSHAYRMLTTSAARRKFMRLVEVWLYLDEPVDPHPMLASHLGLSHFGEGFGSEAREELRKFLEWVVFEKEGSFKELLSDSSAFPYTEGLAKVLDVEVADHRIELLDDRAGVLVRPAIIGSPLTQTQPISRGLYILDRIFCDKVPSPGADVVNSRLDKLEELPALEYSTRERVSEVTRPAACMTCHVAINSLGFALEELGPAGEMRSSEVVLDDKGQVAATHHIDSSSEISIDGTLVRVSHLGDVLSALAESERVKRCFISRIIENIYMRPLSEGDRCSVRAGIDTGPEASVLDIWVNTVVNEDIFWGKI